MKIKNYFISDKNGKSNCVVRSLCKVLDKPYEEVYNELLKIANENNLSYNDIYVFETYMEKNNIIKTKDTSNIKVSELDIDEGTYIVFCYDKKDYYHMFPIINNVVYDKNDLCLNLYVISIYECFYN